MAQPRVLLVAPLSGHFATLLRATVKTLLPEHDVYITDWHNARDVPLLHGRFGFDDYIEHLIRFLEVIGPGAHVIAVCQPCVAALVAVAVMAQGGHPAQPRTMTLMAGPIDTRVNPDQGQRAGARASRSSGSSGTCWRACRCAIPARSAASIPGFVQLAAFMSMNIERHVNAHRDLYDNLVRGEHEKAETIKAFYDEYFAVLDLTAEFYIETVRLVFQEHTLPLGTLTFRGATGGAARDPAHHAADGRRRAGRHLRGRPDARRARPVHRACAPISSATTCRPASATTACSAARNGRTRSTRSCATRYWRAGEGAGPAQRSRSYFGLRGNGMNPSRFGILTLGSDCASSTSSAPTIPLRLRM